MLILIVLAARVDAAPDDALVLAERYADILTGVDQDAAADTLDDDEEPDVPDAQAEEDDADSDDPDLLDDLLGELAGADLAAVTVTPGALPTTSAVFPSAGGAELYDAWLRHQRPSPFGRFDLDVSWRSYSSDPRVAPHYHSDELWLYATWRR